MAKDPKNTNIFSTLGASNHSENERQKEDYYATDPRFINHLIEKEPWLKNPELKILEPSAGEGILVDRFFELTGNKMDAYDLIARREDIIEQNYFTSDFSNKYDVILTNPPYLKDTIKTTEGLSEYILKTLREVKVGGTVIMFLKTLHLESKVRYEKIYKIIHHQSYISMQIEFLVIKIMTLLCHKARFHILFSCGQIKKKMERLIKIQKLIGLGINKRRKNIYGIYGFKKKIY